MLHASGVCGTSSSLCSTLVRTVVQLMVESSMSNVKCQGILCFQQNYVQCSSSTIEGVFWGERRRQSMLVRSLFGKIVDVWMCFNRESDGREKWRFGLDDKNIYTVVRDCDRKIKTTVSVDFLRPSHHQHHPASPRSCISNTAPSPSPTHPRNISATPWAFPPRHH